MLKRDSGKLVFTVADRGVDIQLFVSKAVVGDDAFGDVKALDRGDWIGAGHADDDSLPARSPSRLRASSCSPRRSDRSRTSGTAWPTPTSATGSATPTSPSTPPPAGSSRSATPS